MPTSTLRSPRVRAAAAATLLLSLLAAVPARAQAPLVDVVLMTNGDRLTGEIKSLSRGKLSFDAKGPGVVGIKWEQVSGLTSARLFQVETLDGTRFLGALPPAGLGKLLVVGLDGTQQVLDLPWVVGIVPIGRSFLRRLDGSINVGGSYTQASGVAQLSFAVDVRARRPMFEWRIRADEYVTLESESGTSERFSAGVGYSRYLSGRWAVFGGAQVERNPDLGFDVRTTIAGGFERTLQRSNRSSVSVGAGLGISREAPVDAPSENLVPALLTFRHSFFTYSTPKTSLDTTLSVFPILNQSGRWRLEANTTVSREIFKNFSIACSLYESYDSRPPSVEANRNDTGATLSIAYTF